MRLESKIKAGRSAQLVLLCAAMVACGGEAAEQPTGELTPSGANVATANGAINGEVSGELTDRTQAPRVVILGTSLTAGLGLEPDSAWPALVQRLADSAGVRAEIVNAGLSGETSAGALRRADWVLGEPADLVVLEVGANDGLRGVDPDTTQATLVALIERVRTIQPDARIVLVQMEAPPNLGASYTTRFRAAYTRAAETAGVPLLPFLLNGVAGDPEMNQTDGIHPNERGSKIVAATMWEALAPLLRDLNGQQ